MKCILYISAGVSNLRHMCHIWHTKQVINGTQGLSFTYRFVTIHTEDILTLTCIKNICCWHT